MRISNIFYAVIFIAALFMASCNPDDSITPSTFSFAKGALITNEGSFGKANGSLSFYYSDKDSMANDVYAKANGSTVPLGDVIQSALIVDSLCYVVADNSNKVVVINIKNFKRTTEIADIVLPRYCMVYNNKLWISCWGNPTQAGYVSIRNLSTLAEEKKITTGAGPEKMIVHNGKVFVANCGGYVSDNTVSVIDPNSLALSATIKNFADDPTDFAIDANNTLWVLCAGISYPTNTSSKLHRINESAMTTDLGLLLSTDSHPNHLALSKDKKTLFYGGGYGFNGIFKIDINAPAVPAKPFIDKSFYGFSINPATDEIYGLEAANSTSNGNLIRYKADGSQIKSYPVGINPNGAVFIN